MKQEETYEFELYCANCEESEIFDIPWGKLVEDFAKEQICSYCGCKTLGKEESQDEE